MERCGSEKVDAGHLCKETSYGKSDSPLLAPGSAGSVQGQILDRSHADSVSDCPRFDSVRPPT